MSNLKILVNSKIACDDSILIELKESLNIELISDIKVYSYNSSKSLNESTDLFDIDYRYSYDSEVYSEWKSINNNNIFTNDFTWLSFRLKYNTQTSILIDCIELNYKSYTNENVKDCQCNISVNKCSTNTSNQNSFLIDCNNSYLYNVGFGMVNMWNNLSNQVFKSLGWNVIYFKCNEVEESKDVVFKEWSLLKVESCKKLKIIVPNNDFGSGEISFGEFDIGFSDDLEIEVNKESFWTSYGNGQEPREKDFLYFPLERRMYRVNSVQPVKGYMRQVAWFKVNLIKWNESDSIYKSDSVQNTLDDLTLDFDDFEMKYERSNEIIDVTSPQQYVSRDVSINDNCRESVNLEWEKNGIVQENLSNFFTVFSKFHYNLYLKNYTLNELQNREVNETIITYQQEVDLSKNYSVMFWIKPNINMSSSLFTDSNNNVSIDLESDSSLFKTLSFMNSVYTLDLPLNDLYAIYIGVNISLNELTIRIFKRKDVNQRSTKMDVVFEDIKKGDFKTNSTWKVELNSLNTIIASIRFLKNVVTLENQISLFNRLIFKDESLGYIVDDCYPMQYLEKMNNR